MGEITAIYLASGHFLGPSVILTFDTSQEKRTKGSQLWKKKVLWVFAVCDGKELFDY